MATTTVPDPAAGRGWLYDLGAKYIGSVAPPAPVVKAVTPPNGFPKTVPVEVITFSDWSTYVDVADVQIARVSSADEVAAVCTWAAQNATTIRPVGEGHNWSPLVLAADTPPEAKVMLVDTTKLTACTFGTIDGVPAATFGTGITIDAATAYLQGVDNGNPGSAAGYALPQTTAPGNLTLGGILAIGGHGTIVPSGTDEADLMGCLSNLILAFDAVVTDPSGADPNAYVVRHFDRADGDASAFLVHLGRAFLTSVTLRVVPNYYLQLSWQFPSAADLFAPPSAGPPGAQSFAGLLDECGRVEVLWFPYVTQTFVQCNKLQATRIERQVDGPYNYPWMNDIPLWGSELIKAALVHEPQLTPVFTLFEWAMSAYHQEGKPPLNGVARDLEIYLKDTTLRVSLFGWALQLPRADVQEAASQFYQQVHTMLEHARAAGKYPINAAMEIRCTTVDRVDALPAGAAPPTLAATHSVDPANAALDTVIWLNLGTITGTPGANEFYTELETWITATWGKQQPNRLRPEWSKAWAYTAAGPWTNTAMIQAIRDSYNQSPDAPSTFDWAATTLAKYDGANLFTNPLLQQLFAD
jgi:FAD/FMN-containing dehydrogenase